MLTSWDHRSTISLYVGSHEAYVRAILAPACAPVEKGGLGYRGVVVNFRGCESFIPTTYLLVPSGRAGRACFRFRLVGDGRVCCMLCGTLFIVSITSEESPASQISTSSAGNLCLTIAYTTCRTDTLCSFRLDLHRLRFLVVHRYPHIDMK